MNYQQTALRIALEALEWITQQRTGGMIQRKATEAITAIKQALKQPVQEPVAMRMPKVGDRVVCIDDESLGTVVYLTAGGSPEIRFDDGSHGTYMLREFAELFGYATPPAAQPATEKSLAVQPAPVQDSTCSETLRAQGKAYPRTCRKCGKGPCIGAPKQLPAQPAPVQEPLFWYKPYPNGMYNGPIHNAQIGDVLRGSEEWTPLYTTPPAQEFVCSTGLCHYKPAAADLQAELEATNKQVEILSDALAESRREVAALKAVQEPKQCGLCGEAQPFTGTCGGGRDNPKALCTTPPATQRPWVGLTDEEIFLVLSKLQKIYNGPLTEDSRVIFALAIEAKLREKNT